MKRMNWLTAGVSTEKMVVTTVADCCSTFRAAWRSPAPIALSALRTSSSRASGWFIDLQLLLDQRADLGGAAEPIG